MGPLCSGRPTPAHTANSRAPPRARSHHPLGAAHVPLLHRPRTAPVLRLPARACRLEPSALHSTLRARACSTPRATARSGCSPMHLPRSRASRAPGLPPRPSRATPLLARAARASAHLRSCPALHCAARLPQRQPPARSRSPRACCRSYPRRLASGSRVSAIARATPYAHRPAAQVLARAARPAPAWS
jgi:hypothetical protein